MKLIELFKVPLFVAVLDLDTKSIEKYCLDHQDKDDGRILTNVGGYQSHEVKISPLVREINKYLNVFSGSHAIDKKLVIAHMWININEFKDYNITHFHTNALFSGVYYVKTPDKCGNIIFENPSSDVMTHNYGGVNFKEYNVFNSITHWQSAKENTLYVFPGWLKHRVGPNLSNEKRISISFNISY